MAITLHPLKILIPKITLKCLLAQGTAAKLMLEATYGPERKELKPTAHVQVQGMILILTPMISTGSLVDTIRSRESERERSSSRGAAARDGYIHDRDDKRHSSNVVDRDKVDSREAAHSRHRERSNSHSRSDLHSSSDLRESAHFQDEIHERERRNGSSRHRDYERKRDMSKDQHREPDRADREKVRKDRDREWQRIKGRETCRSGEGRDIVSNSNRHRDWTRLKYSTSDGYKERPRSEERARDVDHKIRAFEEMKGSSFR
jgi:serine/threonine-protein kinase PRP4